MSRDQLTKMTKIEVVATGGDASIVCDLLKAAGARGFTSVSGVSGLGHDGYHQGRLLFNEQAALELIISVVPSEQADEVIASLTQLLQETSGVMFVSDTYVSRPEYFA
jgi:nitrogen regulatory protein PII